MTRLALQSFAARHWRPFVWTVLLSCFEFALRSQDILHWTPAEQRIYLVSIAAAIPFWWASFHLLSWFASRGPLGRVGFVALALMLTVATWLPFGVYFHYGTFPIRDMVIFLANAPGMVADVGPHLVSFKDIFLFVVIVAAIGVGGVQQRAAAGGAWLPVLTIVALVAVDATVATTANLPLTTTASTIQVVTQLIRWNGAPPAFFTLRPRYPPQPPPQSPSPTDGYNYLWIVGESMGARYFHAYGARDENAPFLDHLLESPEAIRLEHMNASSTCTDVSFPSLMSGMEPTRPLSQYVNAELPYDVMKLRGAETFLISSHKLTWAHLDQFLADRYLDRMQGAETLHPNPPDNFGAPDSETYAAGLGEMDRIDRAGGHFFGVLHVRTMHTPYQVDPMLPEPPTESTPAGASARYAASMQYFDRMFSEFWSAFQQRSYGKKTIVFFLSDHGESFGQHGGYTHCARYFDEETRVPSFVYAPRAAWNEQAFKSKLEQIDANRGEYASTIDLLPTLLDLAGVDLKPFAAQFDGQPLTQPLPEDRRYLISNCADFRRCPIRAFAYYQRGIKYIYLSFAQRWFAFDLANDPGETRDVSRLHQEEIATATKEFLSNPTLADLLHARAPTRVASQ